MVESKPNRELVVLALAVLGGSTTHVHTEDIAVRCHELFPDSFSWVKYPKFPDKDIVRVALTDARKDRYGALVEGRVGRRKDEPDGWVLTDAGKTWLETNMSFLDSSSGSTDLKLHRQKILKQLKRVKDHPLYGRYLDDQGGFAPSIGEIAELIRCRVDARPTVWSERFDKIHRQAQASDQDDVVRFIELCRSAYEEQK